jgi:hypothetical protein
VAKAGTLDRDAACTQVARHQRLQTLRRHDWVEYAKTPLAGPAVPLQYRSRYTYRTAIGHQRLQGIEGDKSRNRLRR